MSTKETSSIIAKLIDIIDKLAQEMTRLTSDLKVSLGSLTSLMGGSRDKEIRSEVMLNQLITVVNSIATNFTEIKKDIENLLKVNSESYTEMLKMTAEKPAPAQIEKCNTDNCPNRALIAEINSEKDSLKKGNSFIKKVVVVEAILLLVFFIFITIMLISGPAEAIKWLQGIINKLLPFLGN